MQKATKPETLKKIREVIQDGYPAIPSFSGQLRISPSSNRSEDIEAYISASPRIISILDDLLLGRSIVAQKGLEYLQIPITDEKVRRPIFDPYRFTGALRISPSSHRDGDYEVYISAEYDCICILDRILLRRGIIPQKGRQFIRIRIQGPLY